MTHAVYSEDAYARSCNAVVAAVTDEGVVLDQTVFYPLGGGQPGDTGRFVADTGRWQVTDSRHGPAGQILHKVEDPAGLEPGMSVGCEIDWDRRYRHMRMHTALHLLGALIPAPVTGGNISEKKSRLDFDTDMTLDKEELTIGLARLIEAGHPVGSRWITQRELASQPELIRTMSVKPPTHVPRIRLLHIPDVDLQPCGGTHVRNTREIGAVRVSKVENKGRQNKRVSILFAD